MYPVRKLMVTSDSLSTFLTQSEDKMISLLVSKVAHSSEHHRHAMFIGGGNYFIIAH